MIRWTGIWAGLLAVLLVLAACGDGDANTTAPAATVGDPERGRQIWDDGGGVIGGGHRASAYPAIWAASLGGGR